MSVWFPRLFAESPFGPLIEHQQKVSDSVALIPDLVEAALAQEYEQTCEVARQLSQLEHEADELKNRLRDSLPKTRFMQVSRPVRSSRQFNDKFRSPRVVVLDANHPIMIGDDRADNGQAQSHPSLFGREIGFKQSGFVIIVDAGPIVYDFEADHIQDGIVGQGNVDISLGFHRGNGIFD